MKNVLITIFACLLVLGVKVGATDMVIDAKHQSFSESENKIKFKGEFYGKFIFETRPPFYI